jgi:hypothetical protein
MKSKIIQFTVVLCLFFAIRTAHAQLSASHIVGDQGLQAGSQPPPGIYMIYFLYNYDTSTIVGPNGGELSFKNGDVSAWGHAFGASLVTNKKILGGNYGASAFFLPFRNLSIEAPRVDLNAESGYGYTDLWVQPIQLGWHKKQADFITWYAFYAPTGSYEAGANDNHGYGQWSHELSLGSTVYFDENRAWHAATVGSLEFHSEKKDSDAKTGSVLTLEGGVGSTYKKFLTAGVAYYSQWKLTDDSGLDVRPIVQNRIGKNRSFALGPEVGVVLPLSKDFKKLMILNFRYEFETSARLDTKGNIAALTAIFKLN